MKIVKVKILCFILIFPVLAQSTSQDDIFRTVDLKLKSEQEKKVRYKFEGESKLKIKTVKNIVEVEDKNTIRFYGDSLIGVSDNLRNEKVIDLITVKEISFADGKSWGKGALYGILSGALIGLLTAALGSGGGLIISDTGAIIISTGLFGSIGAITGLIVGGFIDDYRSYELSGKDLKLKKNEIITLSRKYKRR